MIKVIDIYSGNDWWSPDAAKADGYSGVIFKGGQGTYVDVPKMRKTWASDAHSIGLKVGWYWVVDSRYKISSQVTALRQAIGDNFGELGIWADCEKPFLGMTDTAYWKTPYAGMKNLVDFVYLLELQTKVRAGVYTSPGFWNLINQKPNQANIDYLAKSKLWTAQYPWVYVPGFSKPTKYGGWAKPTFWQYTERPDVNLYMGTDDEFNNEFTGTYSQPPVPVVLTTMYVTSRTGLWMRVSPNGAKIQALKYNGRVKVSEVVSGWAHVVSYNDKPVEGWSSTAWLKE